MSNETKQPGAFDAEAAGEAVAEAIELANKIIRGVRYGTRDETFRKWIDTYAAARTLLPALAGHVVALAGENKRLTEIGRELLQAMYRYEMDVDETPTRRHQDMMQRAAAALATPAAGKGEERAE